MSTFLKKSNYTRLDVEWFIISLYGQLSKNWYPVNLINSGVYRIFEMYAQELLQIDTEEVAVWNDLFVELARITPIEGRNQSKLYENFGALFSTPKLSEQNSETYNTTYDLQSYRQSLRFLTQGANNGTTEEGLYRVGHAHSGIGTIVLSEALDIQAWRLTSYEGTIVDVGVNNDFVVVDIEIPPLGHIIPVPASGSYHAGDTFAVDYSSLGISTYLSSEDAYANRVKLYNFVSDLALPSASGSIEQLSRKFSSAGMVLLHEYTNNYVYSRFTADYDPNYASFYGDHLINLQRTPDAGFLVESEVLGIDPGLVDIDWVYDWCVLEANDSTIQRGARDYPISGSIPDTVPYRYYNPESVGLADFTAGVNGGHWVFDDINKLWDISGHQNNLDLVDVGYRGVIQARRQHALGLINTSSRSTYSGGDITTLMPGNHWMSEMWVYGISGIHNITEVSLTLGSVGTPFGSGFSSGFGSSSSSAILLRFGIDGANQTIFVEIDDSGTVERVEVSIADYFLEVGIRPHYIAVTYYEGSLYFIIDNKILNTAPLVLLNNLPAPTTGNATIALEGNNIGLDEVLIQEGVFLPEDLVARFEKGRARLYSKILPYEHLVNRFHQGCFLLRAKGAKELEVHQFSIGGIPSKYYDIWNRTADIIQRVPFRLTIPPPVLVTSITVTSEGDATQLITGNTLQMYATVLPVDATHPDIIWTVEPISGTGTIDANGLLTGGNVGIVRVRATATDGTGISGFKDIEILPIPTHNVTVNPYIEYTQNIL